LGLLGRQVNKLKSVLKYNNPFKIYFLYFSMKFTFLQKKIVFSVFAFILGSRAIRYTYSKYLQVIISEGNYFDLFSLFQEFAFFLWAVLFAASVLGFISVIKEVWHNRETIVVRERYAKLLISSLWTLIISILLAMIVKILLWP
jgi:hypothetical protein